MLTFQKIREVQREEKDTTDLQDLPDTFFKDVKDYLKRKENVEDKTDSEQREIDNIKNTIKNIIELREKKLINSTLYAVRTGMPPENMTPSEKKTYEIIKKALKELRKDFFEKVERGEEITQKETPEPKEKKDKYIVKKEVPPFVGPDLKEYNLKKGKRVDLPKPLNDLLLKKGVIAKGNNGEK